MVKPRRTGWQILPGKGCWLPRSHTCFLRGKSSSAWSFFCTGARASHAAYQLSHTPSLAGALRTPAWRGNTTALPALVRRSSLWSPLVLLVENAECTLFPLLMLKLRARPEVKNKNQKQSSWAAVIWNHPLCPSPSLELTLHPALLYGCSYVWQGQFWCGEGTCWESPFVL